MAPKKLPTAPAPTTATEWKGSFTAASGWIGKAAMVSRRGSPDGLPAAAGPAPDRGFVDAPDPRG
jgi:hypothetical protein